MKRYIGLDAHTQTCTLTVMSARGRRLREQVVETKGKALVDFVKTVVGPKMLCLEEGTHSEWLHEILAPHVDRAAVIQPEKKKGSKNDSMDAWWLAEQARVGLKKEVYKGKPSKAVAELREAVRLHQSVTSDLVRAKNRLRAVFRSRALHPDAADLYCSETRAEWLPKLPQHRRHRAKILGEQLDMLIEMHQEAERELQSRARRIKDVKRLAQLPGIGPIRAATIVGIAITPRRFRTRSQFWSYCGLGVVSHSSSDWERAPDGKWIRTQRAQPRGLNRNRQPQLKAVFKGAANTVIKQMSRHPLHKDYERLLERGLKDSVATVTLARRIASIALAVWKKKEDYDPARLEPHDDA